MKKNNSNQQVSKRNKSFFAHLLPIFALLLSVNGLMAQQVIGTFPYMNGGFEGQTAGSLGTDLHSTDWSRQNASTSSIVTTTPRTGVNYATVTNPASITTTGLASPQLTPFVANKAPTGNTDYIVQFWAKNAEAIPDFQVGVSVNGLDDIKYSPTGYTLPANSTWTKYTIAIKSDDVDVTSSGVVIIGRTRSEAIFDIDDVCIYPGTEADFTPPGRTGGSGGISSTSTTVSLFWTENSNNGVDGGGYIVIRSLSQTTTRPNDNGIYAVGNFVADGQKVVYLGTDLSFVDTGLTPSTTYWYRTYAVDKAFNYSSATTGYREQSITTQSDPTTRLDNGKESQLLFDGQIIHNNANVDIKVFDATGKLILTSNKSVNMVSKPNGIYIIKSELGTKKIAVIK